MTPYAFRSTLVRPEGVGTWTFAPIPKAVSEKAQLRSHQRVKGTIDAVPFASSLIPRGGGILFIVVNGELRERLGKAAGDVVEVTMEPDARPAVVPVPPSLRRALSKDAVARKKFDALAPSHRKAFALWVAGAKQEETRERRTAKSLEMLHRGEHLN
jgi:hypothetical protein